mmetsp:Transcript_5357/g.13459  ORF Transcript_5357/g.13459 Transcript_5357/m.13459 type:complete len:153 (+) Transcript_5357:150-608(+)
MQSTAFEATGKRKGGPENPGHSTGGTSKQHKHRSDARTTLGSLLKYMEGYEVIVELKTGKRHRGLLVSADDNMNLILEEDSGANDGNEPQGGTTTAVAPSPLLVPNPRNIRGSKIRYIHFPDNANLPVMIRSGRERERNASKKYQKTKRVRK